jgi:ABC-2 type transport system permease protein
MRRELSAYLRTPLGWVIAAILLLLDGLLFNAYAIGSETTRKSAEVLAQFFFFSGGVAEVAGLFLAMRLLAEERQAGTLNLLFSSPIRDYQIVLGKFLAAFVFLTGITVVTLYMPMLILVHGKVTKAHLIVGYLGVLCMGSLGLAIGMFSSALTRSQLVAVVIGAAISLGLVLMWKLAEISDRPFDQLFSWLALWNKHFPPFMRGSLSTQDVTYYVTMTYFFLFATTRVLESRRWSS